MIIPLHSDPHWFPETVMADADGLLAFGGDLREERLLEAYRRGIFPWYSDETPILWYAPPERFVLEPAHLHLSKSMMQLLKSGKFHFSMDTCFEEVIRNCARVARKEANGTWITDEMQKAYISLNKKGFAHSVEVWHDETLVGGLYGIRIGSIFCGESMFSLESNASKAALAWLCTDASITLIDCQIYSEHLEKMGAVLIPREEFEELLR